MISLNKYQNFVKEQAEFNERSASKYRNDEKRSLSYQQRAATFRELLADLENLSSPKAQDRSLPLPGIQFATHLTQEDIKDLPEELLKELGLTESDRKDFLCAEIIDELGGVASINKILIGIFRRTNEVEKRTRLVSRLYRMTGKGLIYPHPTMKGVYSTKPVSENDIVSVLSSEHENVDDTTEVAND